MLNTGQLSKMPFYLFVLIIAILLFFSPISSASTVIDNKSSAWETSQIFIKVAKKAMPTVVFIRVEKKVEGGQTFGPFEYNNPYDLFNDEFFERFFGHRSPLIYIQPKGFLLPMSAKNLRPSEQDCAMATWLWNLTGKRF